MSPERPGQSRHAEHDGVRPDGAVSPGRLAIRIARPDELDAAADVIRAGYAEYAEQMPPGRWDRYIASAADVRRRLDQADLIVAEHEGRLVGTVTFFANGAQSVGEDWPPDWVGIRLLAVAPEARGLGIGRALMEWCIDRARSLGATAVALHTTEMMAVARAMYERMGFVRAPDYDYHPASGRTVMAYRLDLR